MQSRPDLVVNQTARMPILTIPDVTEGSADFKQRLAILINAPTTHIYIDTSFLMWMTKIGTSSRQELISWFQQYCMDRVHVPKWATHEYLKHHVAGSIVADLAEKTNEVTDLVGRTYTYFRPFIDEPIGKGAEDPPTIRANTRAALKLLDRMAATSRQWRKSYQKHASEVIAFINEVTPEQTSIYEHLEDITQTGAGRFVGSVPPGYQDRGKKGREPQFKEPKDAALADSNRYGDLVFWKELLSHAKQAKAMAVVVITNDRKNDWHMGGNEEIDIDSTLLELRSSWKPVPRPHPMLVMEAKLVAEVDQVELLDSAYLGALLLEVAVTVDDLKVQRGEAGTDPSVLISARTEDGRKVIFHHDEIRDWYGNIRLDHGYALTITSAQGLTVDRTFLLPMHGRHVRRSIPPRRAIAKDSTFMLTGHRSLSISQIEGLTTIVKLR